MKKALLVLSLISLGTLAHAQSSDSSSSVKASELAPAPTAQGSDVDSEITNAKLRTQAGSKSKLSMKADLSYNGGSIQDVFGAKRPNYTNSANTESNANFGGTVGAAYRVTPHDAVRLGTGFNITSPFQDSNTDLTNSNGVHKTSVSNPYLDYSHSAKIGDTQNITDASVTGYTQTYYTDVLKATSNVDVNQTVVYEIGHWSPGINVDANYTFYKDAGQASDVSSLPDDGRVDLELAIFPYVEYSLTEKINIRTVFRFLTWDHYRLDSGSTFLREVYSQSVGVGFSLSRDIFLYPNVQFAPERLSQDKTNVGVTATINL